MLKGFDLSGRKAARGLLGPGRQGCWSGYDVAIEFHGKAAVDCHGMDASGQGISEIICHNQ